MAHKNSLLELEVTGVVNEQSREVEIVKTACRKRKPNFSAQEIAIITQKFEENQVVLKSKFTNTNTNKMKQNVWEEMTVAVNAVGTAHRSVSEVKEKWTNLQRTAKNELSKFRKEQRKTGGGPPPKLPSKGTDKTVDDSHQRIIQWDNLIPPQLMQLCATNLMAFSDCMKSHKNNKDKR